MSVTAAFTLDDGVTTVSVTGTKPFVKKVTGMTSSELEVFSADGSRALVKLHGQASTSIFANNFSGNTLVDEIVTKANA
jgi:hypothetical protein